MSACQSGKFCFLGNMCQYLEAFLVCSPSTYWLEHKGISCHFTIHKTTLEKEITIGQGQYQRAMRLLTKGIAGVRVW